MNKICFICPSLHQGGLENAVTVMANEMARRGHEVNVICFYNNPVFYELNDSIKIILPSYERRHYSTITYYLKAIHYIRTQIRSLQPDIIVSYGDYINPLAIIASRGLKIPIYISDRSSPLKQFPFLVRKLRKYLYPFASGIIAQTERAKQQKIEMLGMHYQNIKVIPNPIRPIIEYPEVDRENIILGVGRHYKVKGLDHLIKAYSKLSAPDWRLVIAGNFGPHTHELKLLVKHYGLQDKVEFLGAIKEIDKLYSKAKIFVLSSRSEGFPNALIEAMAHGLACISYDIVAGPSEIISHLENGILVNEGDISELHNKIEFLIHNQNERDRLMQNALKIKNDLSIQRIGTVFHDFITNKQ